MVVEHLAAAELALARQNIGRTNGSNGSALVVPAASLRGQAEPKPAQRERELDTCLDAQAWNDWADQRADVRIAAALDARQAVQTDAIGFALAEERRRGRGEIAKAVDAAKKEFRSELDTLRREISSLHREISAQRAIADLHKQAARRDVELARLRDEFVALREDTGPVVKYFNDR